MGFTHTKRRSHKDPLIQKGEVPIEQEGHEYGAEKGKVIESVSIGQERIKKLERYNAEFCILQKQNNSMQAEFEQKLSEMSVDFKVKIKNQIQEFEKLQEATERKHRQEIQRLLKDTNEKEEELLKQIDEREVNIRVLEDTSTSRLGDKAFLQTILSMDQP